MSIRGSLSEVVLEASSLYAELKILLDVKDLEEQRVLLLNIIRDLELNRDCEDSKQKILILDQTLNLISSLILVGSKE